MSTRSDLYFYIVMKSVCERFSIITFAVELRGGYITYSRHMRVSISEVDTSDVQIHKMNEKKAYSHAYLVRVHYCVK